MPRSQEFLDALETARAGVEARLARHQTEVDPAHVERIVQAHAEQLHQARKLVKWKENRGMGPVSMSE
jgi:hypothetical protein